MGSIFATNLKNLRLSKNVTQQELALMLNYSDKNISKWERGESIPNIDVLSILCDFFDLSKIEDLLHKDLTNEIKFNNLKNIAKKLNIVIKESSLNLLFELLKIYPDKLILTNDKLEETIDDISTLKEVNFVEEYYFITCEEDTKLQVKLNKDFYINYSNGSLNNCFKKNVIFNNAKEYIDYINDCNFSQQNLIVLDYIDNLDKLEFTIADLYDNKLLSVLEEKYKKNKDVKKIIRTSVSKLMEKEIIDKIGYAKYRKKFSTFNEKEIFNDNDIKLLNKKLNLKFDNYNKEYAIDLDVFKKYYHDNNISISKIKNYLNYLLNLQLITNYALYINDIDFTNKEINSKEKIIKIKYDVNL